MTSQAISKDLVKKPAKKFVNGYEAPKNLPLNSVITDLYRNQWKVGKFIGSGGFGEIYSVCRANSLVKKDYPYVVKIEPHGNGPLFVEMHFYKRVGKPADIASFKETRGLKSLGMPVFVSNGSHVLEGVRHRFIVMERYGKDIWKYFQEQGRKFPEHTIYRLALQILYVLEYIHSHSYVHGDIKGANILTGFGKDDNEQVYLADFGLASHFATKEFKPNPKKMHNGTREYTSRDAHLGVPTMRGDLEILAYNLIQWRCGFLPWQKQNFMNDPVKVQAAKEECMKNVDKFMKTCFDENIPAPIYNFVKYVNQLKYNEIPDYVKSRKMFEQGLKSLGKTDSGPLEFGKALPIKTEVQDINSPVKSPMNKNVIPKEPESSPEDVVPIQKSRKRIETEPSILKSKKPATKETITLNSKSSSIEVNLKLDISIGGEDFVINLHSKEKNKEKEEDKDKKRC